MSVLSKYTQVAFVLGQCIKTGFQPLHGLLRKATFGWMSTFAGCSVLCVLLYSLYPARELDCSGKAVFLTGCDTGFGNALAKELNKLGFRVFAGCLASEGPGANELRTHSSRIRVIQCDVTDAEQVKAAADVVAKETKTSGLWGLVNNAGVFYLADAEMTSELIFRRVLDVNVMGAARVTRAFLPMLREGRGRVVNISSVSGKLGFRFMAAYTASKHALEGYTDVLRLELRKYGVSVTTIRPSGYQTAAASALILKARKDAVWQSLDNTTRDRYGREYLEGLYEEFSSTMRSCPGDVSAVVRAVRRALVSSVPRERCAVGTGAGTLLGVVPLLPVWMTDRLLLCLGAVRGTTKPVFEVMAGKR